MATFEISKSPMCVVDLMQMKATKYESDLLHISIEYESCDVISGRTFITICGRSLAAVQAEVDRVFLATERMTGFAYFDGPRRNGLGFKATGEVWIDP